MRQRNSLLKLLTGARVACLAPLYAQEAQRPLTNADIINMVKSKLPESVIVQSIQSNPASYDTSAITLVSLRKFGLTEKEPNAMMAASSIDSSNVARPTSGAGPTAGASNAIPASKSHMPKVDVLTGGQATKPTVLLTPQRTTVLSPSCTVSHLELRFRTGNDDLRGGQNNLNVEVHLADGTMQVANNVNRGANWGNNSTNVVTVPLQHPVAPNQITMIRLVHLAHGGFSPGLNPSAPEVGVLEGIKSEDNWDMAEFQAFGRGSGINVPIASFGSHRFTGSNPSLDIHVQPGVGCPTGNQVSRIVFTFQTGDDDLRGGKDNLNITIHFADGTTQFEPNVNHGERWPDGSTKGAEVLLNRPATINQIQSITLSTTFLGGGGGDNWNMASMQADALVDGKPHTIAKYGFHRFSADWSGPKAREITIPVHVIN